MSLREQVPAALKDLIKAFCIGLVAGFILAVVCFLGGLVLGGSGVSSGIEASKDALFLVTAVLLFILAGMLLIKGKNPERSFAQNGWRDHFAILGPKAVIAVFAVVGVILAASLDYVQLMMT